MCLQKKKFNRIKDAHIRKLRCLWHFLKKVRIWSIKLHMNTCCMCLPSPLSGGSTGAAVWWAPRRPGCSRTHLTEASPSLVPNPGSNSNSNPAHIHSQGRIRWPDVQLFSVGLRPHYLSRDVTSTTSVHSPCFFLLFFFHFYAYNEQL